MQIKIFNRDQWKSPLLLLKTHRQLFSTTSLDIYRQRLDNLDKHFPDGDVMLHDIQHSTQRAKLIVVHHPSPHGYGYGYYFKAEIELLERDETTQVTIFGGVSAFAIAELLFGVVVCFVICGLLFSTFGLGLAFYAIPLGLIPIIGWIWQRHYHRRIDQFMTNLIDLISRESDDDIQFASILIESDVSKDPLINLKSENRMAEETQPHQFTTNKTLYECIISLEQTANTEPKLQDKIRLVSESFEDDSAAIRLSFGRCSLNGRSLTTADIRIVDEGSYRVVNMTVTLSDNLIFVFVLMLAGWMILSMLLLSVTRFAALLFLIGIPISVVWYQRGRLRCIQEISKMIQATLTARNE